MEMDFKRVDIAQGQEAQQWQQIDQQDWHAAIFAGAQANNEEHNEQW